ncbi:hypothetical protein SAY86_007215 [Trapa natans]|uniref:Protein kinase domain-containing protein n=1 Tax=Trapa natans TaxID=22666 RepID=A0AAN7LLH2_TRANT|nr:hypothetical protein SAY86_007215 [Trapa natans]
MEELNRHSYTAPVLSILSSSLILLLLALPFVSSATDDGYTLPTEYFINCGSADTVKVDSRNFTGDSKTSFLSLTEKGSSEAVSSDNSSVTGLYGTARIFRAQNAYRFKIQRAGFPHFVRLHFSGFSGGGLNLFEAHFDVSVPGLTLLGNFTVPPVGSNGSSNSSILKEFLLTIKGNVLDLSFSPIGSSSFAFVNALEVFPVPMGLINASAIITRVGAQGQNGNLTLNGREVLAPKYRLNCGGPLVDPASDTLWRQWSTDDEFLQNSADSRTVGPKDINFDVQTTGVDNYTAPAAVYQTARDLNVSGGNYPNVTWRFSVNPNSSYLVRFHFCDIKGIGDNTLWFILYVFDHYGEKINPYDRGVRVLVPYKIDLAIQSGSGGFIEVGIGNDTGSNIPDAYLNGLEVMEVIGSWNWDSTASFANKNHTGMIIGIAVGCSLVLIILLVVILVVLKCRRPKPPDHSATVWLPLPGGGGSHGHKSSDHSISTNSPLPNLHLDLKIPLSEILAATNYFDGKLMIGRGGFGNVYRGTLKNGTSVAVKRSEPGSSQGLSEFHTEIIVLSKIRHRHLVSLFGYCDERSEMILVYEFMEKGTLRDHLYGTDLPPLPWKQRLEICIGAAHGLHYLHTGAAGGIIIHRDVKSTNILLDSNYIAKVADFGLSKQGSSAVEQAEASTRFKGTFGYLDPEYIKTNQLTDKSDVYAFGVVLLEVLCARPALDTTIPREQMNLAEWGIANYEKGTLGGIIDPKLSGQINPNSLRKFGETAEKCLREDDQERPNMADILWDLEYALQLQQGPVLRQMHDDTITNGSSMLGFSAEVQRLPSFSMSLVGDDSVVMK